MALDARHRSSIYRKLVDLIGDDDANALMSELPVAEAEQLVTREYLRAELAEMEARLTTRLGAAIAASTAFLAALGIFT
jgi:hypothetical protein